MVQLLIKTLQYRAIFLSGGQRRPGRDDMAPCRQSARVACAI